MSLHEKLNRNIEFALPSCLFVLTVVSRIPFVSKYLYHMDSVQFALAMDRFDVTLHQPHPPGYFLYVMLGKLLHFFIHDANTVLIAISIFFSGLTVVTVYYLGKEMFDGKTAAVAALIAVTSPCLWFHGEVALTYIVEAFFSTIIALFCWKIYQGKHGYIWYSAIALGLAGGIRQNTLAFLLPLWLFSIKGVRLRSVIASLGVLLLVTSAWFLPMISMTGGLDAYLAALKELWLFNTGNNTVFDQGFPVLEYYASTLFDFTFYGVGAGLFFICLALYSMIRKKTLKYVDKALAAFFAFWILPSILFYLLIFIHPANPGYALVFLPAFILLAAASVARITAEIKTLTGSDLSVIILSVLVVINTCIFFLSKYPVSLRKITDNRKKLEVVLENLKSLDPAETAIFTGPYIFWGYRQIMYYLPDYRVYQLDCKKAPSGQVRRTFWGIRRRTFRADKIVLPGKVSSFALLLTSEDRKRISGVNGLKVREILPTMCIATGPADLLARIYPETDFYVSQKSY